MTRGYFVEEKGKRFTVQRSSQMRIYPVLDVVSSKLLPKVKKKRT